MIDQEEIKRNTDEFGDLTEAKAQELTRILKDDIRWLAEQEDIALNPYWGPKMCRVFEGDEDTGYASFDPYLTAKGCQTCLIGAHLIRCSRQNSWSANLRPVYAGLYGLNGNEAINAFAKLHGIDKHHAKAIYYGAMLDESVIDYPRAALVAVDVLDYAVKDVDQNNGACWALTKENIGMFRKMLTERMEEMNE